MIRCVRILDSLLMQARTSGSRRLELAIWSRVRLRLLDDQKHTSKPLPVIEYEQLSKLYFNANARLRYAI